MAERYVSSICISSEPDDERFAAFEVAVPATFDELVQIISSSNDVPASVPKCISYLNAEGFKLPI
jgi:hypothetical protein